MVNIRPLGWIDRPRKRKSSVLLLQQGASHFHLALGTAPPGSNGETEAQVQIHSRSREPLSSNLSSVTNLSLNLGPDLTALWASVSPSVQWGVSRDTLSNSGVPSVPLSGTERDSPPQPCALTTKRVLLSPE